MGRVGALSVRARVATIKGITMGLFGLWVVGRATLGVAGGDVPHAEVMGLTGFATLVANLSVAVLLYRDRDGWSRPLPPLRLELEPEHGGASGLNRPATGSPRARRAVHKADAR